MTHMGVGQSADTFVWQPPPYSLAHFSTEAGVSGGGGNTRVFTHSHGLLITCSCFSNV